MRIAIPVLEMRSFGVVRTKIQDGVSVGVSGALICFGLALAPPVLLAQESPETRCIDVINASRGETRIIVNKREFLIHQEFFCREYIKSRKNNRTASFGGSYSILSLSHGNTRLSEDAVATKYCREDGAARRSELSYQEYTSQVPRDAFRAYEACVASAREDGVIFDSRGSTITHNQLLFGVQFNADTRDEEANVRWTATDGVICDWDGENVDGRIVTITDSTQVNLQCRRENWSIESVVTVNRTNGRARMAFKWQPYDEDKNPVYPIRDLQDKIEHLNLQLSDLAGRTVRLESGTISMHKREMGSLWDVQGCTGNRGILEKEVRFDRPFSSPPRVMAAISSLDVSGEKNTRL